MTSAAIAGGTILAASAAGVVAAYMHKSPNNVSVNSFPGPKPHPLLGNLRIFPTSHWSDTFKGWQDDYGDVVYLSLAATPVLILGCLEDVEELLEKRAKIWSGRIVSRMANDVMDFGWSLFQIQLSPEFHEQRKVFRKVVGRNVIGDYSHLIEIEADALVRRLASFTGDPLEHIKDSVGKVVITVAYGESVYNERGKELIQLNTEASDLVTYAISNGWLVDIVPFTRSLPSWIPGLSFPKVGKQGKAMLHEIRYTPFCMVKDALEQGRADFSIISKYLNDSELSSEYLRDAIAMMYFGGVDTTSSAVLSFLCHMIMFPEVQKRIQKELDDVIGRDNSPNVAGVQSCSLLQAAWKESLRFAPPIPTGIPHVSSADDHWKGRFIPRGTIVLPNIAFILRDPRLWGDDANDFKPERFLVESNPHAKELPDVGSLPFGFGRRHLAERNGTVLVAAILSAYDIQPPIGEIVPTLVEFTGTQLRRPSNLRVQFSPRK